jgi:spoIIIJ-associated protein
MSQEYIEVSGKTLQDAITSACLKLNVISANLDYTVIDQGSRGFLGLGAKPARIRARAKSASDAAAAILNDVLNKAEKKIQNQAEKAAEAPVKEEAPVKKEKKAPVKAEKAAEEAVKEAAPVKKAETEAAPSEEKTEKKKSRNDSRQNQKSRNRKKNKKPEKAEAAAPARQEKAAPAGEAARAPKKKAEKPQLTPEKIEEINEKALVFLKDVFKAMNLNVDISTSYSDETGILTINMEGEDMGMLIGKRGQTLDSLQYLVSLVVNKGIDGYIHVKADTENYRERRKQTLENLAKNISGKVKRTRKSITLEPMNPYERRIIHSSLQNDRFVTTYSEGEEPYRRVVVALKKGVQAERPERPERSRRDRRGRRDNRAERPQEVKDEQLTVQNVEAPVEAAPAPAAEPVETSAPVTVETQE